MRKRKKGLRDCYTSPKLSRELLALVEESLEALEGSGRPRPAWSKDRRHTPQPLDPRDLAAAYWVVCCNAASEERHRGLSYARFADHFKECRPGSYCHRTQVAALLAALVELELIRKAGNYSARGRGNVYEPEE